MNNLIQIIMFIAIIIRITSLFFVLVYIIPLQWKEAQVKNGLKILRKQLLLSGIILFFINLLGLHLIFFSFHFLGFDKELDIVIIHLFNAILFLVLSIINYCIYTTQYTEENKKRHDCPPTP